MVFKQVEKGDTFMIQLILIRSTDPICTTWLFTQFEPGRKKGRLFMSSRNVSLQNFNTKHPNW